MDSEFLSLTLQNTLDEIQKACPEVKAAFALDGNRELITRGANTPEDTLERAVELFREVLEKAEVLGGAEDFTIEGTNGVVNVSYVQEIYLVTVASNKVNKDTLNVLTHVLLPTVFNVVEKLGPTSGRRDLGELESELETPEVEKAEETVESSAEEAEVEKSEDKSEPEQKVETSLPDIPVNQFIVEDIKGLLTPSDTVRIDTSVMVQWQELFEGRSLEEADVETFTGKSLRCKIKPIKDGKLEGQGKIQIPGKLQDVLDIKKGELVRVKPVVE
jgi:hypothetical protein